MRQPAVYMLDESSAMRGPSDFDVAPLLGSGPECAIDGRVMSAPRSTDAGPAPSAVEHAVAQLPAELRAALDAELDAGNTIADTGTGFPAAPAGCWIKLSGPFRTTANVPDGTRYYARGTPQYAEEMHDARRHFFLLSPPVAEESAPARKSRKPRVKRTLKAASESESESSRNPPARRWWIEIDGRGETITYRETQRWAEIFWGSMTSGDIERSSLRGWLTDGPVVPMTSAEEDLVIERILEAGRSEHGLNISVRD
jgi:hypothetical protein